MMQIMDQAAFERRIDGKLAGIADKRTRDRAAMKLAEELLQLAAWVIASATSGPGGKPPKPDTAILETG